MRYLSIAFIVTITCILAACDDDETTTMSENPVDILASSGAESPDHGDVYLIETTSSDQFIYAYI